MPAALHAVHGYLRRRVLVLPGRGPYVVGRSLEADLTLYGHGMAERHVAFVADDAGHRLVPVRGGGRVRLDGQPLAKARRLRSGDRIELGGHAFVYAADAAAIAPDDDACASCGAHVPALGPAALRLGAGVACARCVDRRLDVDRDLARYRILRKIGANDDEVTYLATDRAARTPWDPGAGRVAIRVLKAEREADPRHLRRFLARAMAGLVVGHPAYLEVQAIAAARGTTYVVLDHHEGGRKLERLVRESKPRAPGAALRLAHELAGVLRHARARQLIVAKRKKSGVLVDRAWRARVLAFDVTRELEEAAVATAAFAELAARCGHDPARLAAAGFLEPRDEEGARLTRLASELAEAYSIGRILFQLLLGRPFVPGPALRELRAAAAHLVGGAPPPGPAPPPPARGLAVAGLAPPLVQLLDRVLVPGGVDRVTTLDGLEEAASACARALGAEGEVDDAGLDTSDEEDLGD